MSYLSETLSIRLSPELRRLLARFSKRTRRPASDVAREALRRYIASEEFRALRRTLRPYGEAKGSHTDEDMFGAVS